MAILENTTDFSAGDQVTPTKLNALTETAKFVKSTGAVVSTGNTTDETTLDVDSSGQIYIKSLGVDTAQVAAGAVENAKLDPTSGGAAVAGSAATGSHVNVIQANSIDTGDLAGDCITHAQIEDIAIREEHLNPDIINGQLSLTTEPVFTEDFLLIYDNGTLRKFDMARYAPLPKAYGLVSFDPSTPSLTQNYNCTLGTDNTGSRQILLTRNMAGANYVVLLTPVDTDGTDGEDLSSPYVFIRNAANFTIAWDIEDEASTRAISFVVFGDIS